jgi:hypothetical protein
MWLANVQAQFVSNLKEAQRQYKENDGERQKDQLNFKFGD